MTIGDAEGADAEALIRTEVASIPVEMAGMRLDRALAGMFPAYSRARLQQWLRDGMISVDGNLYSVPDGTRRRVVEVQALADELRIYEEGRLIAVHEPRIGRGQRALAAGHRRRPPVGQTHARAPGEGDFILARPGDQVAERPLAIYHRIAQVLAREPSS